MLRRLLLLTLLPLAAITLWSCEGKSPAESNPLLSQIPADTPYLFTNTRSYGDEVLDRFFAMYSNDAYKRGLTQIEQAGKAPGAPGFIKLMHAYLSELDGKLSRDGMKSLGLRTDAKFALYGNGVLPVYRSEIADPVAVTALIGRIEKRMGATPTREKYGEVEYSVIKADKNLSVLIGVTKTQLVAALLPTKVYKEYLSQLFGDEKPKANLGDGKLVATLLKDHGFSGHGGGFIDFQRLRHEFTSDDSTSRKLMAKAGGKSPKALPSSCDDLLTHVLRNVPRLVIGHREASTSALRFAIVLEASDGLAGRMRQLSAAVPGMGARDGGILDVGVAMNLIELRKGLRDLANDVIEHGKGCPMVKEKDIRAQVAKLDLVLNPLVTGIKGLNLLLDDIIPPAKGTPPSAAGSIVGAVDDPRGVFGLLTVKLPQVAKLQINTDGKPVQVPAKDLPPFVPPVHVAMEPKVLAIGVGAKSGDDLPGRMGDAPADPAPFLSLGYNPRNLVEKLAPLAEMALAKMESGKSLGKKMQAKALREQLENMKAQAKWLEQLRFSLAAASKGLSIDYALKLR